MIDDPKKPTLGGQKLGSVRQFATGELGPPPQSILEVSGAQVVHADSAVQAAVWDQAIWDKAVWTEDGTQPVHLADDGRIPSGELPDGDPRGIDGLADWDSGEAIVDPDNQTLGAELLVNRSILHPPTIRVEPGPQKLLHDRLERSIDALRAEMEKLGVTRIGHNNPPSAIDDPPVFTAEQVAALLRATDALRQTPPAPRAVPEEAREAQKTLKRIYAEAFAHEMGTQTAQAVGWGLKGCAAAAVILSPLLADVVKNSDAWIALIDRMAKAAGL